MTSLLEVRDVHTFYGKSHILHGVTIGVDAGSVVSLVGRNGSGKTTLVRSIVGFTPPAYGSVVFDGEPIEHLPSYEIIQRGISVVPQGARVFGSLTVLENLEIAARSREGSDEWTTGRVLDLFPNLRERSKSKGHQLSGGERMMLGIARALMGNPRLLIMDEPSQGLAPLMVRQVEETLLGVRGEGISILLVEQNLPLALGGADRVCILSKGKIVYEGHPDELRDDTDTKRSYLSMA